MSQVSLVPTLEADLDVILKMETSSENAPYIGQWELNQHVKAIIDPNIAHLKIVLNNEILGYIILIGLNDPNHSINFRRIVVEKKGCGFGREAIRLVKDMVFNQFQAHRLWLDVMVHNERAYALYSSEGFIDEGICRGCLKQEDRFIDLRIMSLLEQEYKLNRSN